MYRTIFRFFTLLILISVIGTLINMTTLNADIIRRDQWQFVRTIPTPDPGCQFGDCEKDDVVACLSDDGPKEVVQMEKLSPGKRNVTTKTLKWFVKCKGSTTNFPDNTELAPWAEGTTLDASAAKFKSDVAAFLKQKANEYCGRCSAPASSTATPDPSPSQ